MPTVINGSTEIDIPCKLTSFQMFRANRHNYFTEYSCTYREAHWDRNWETGENTNLTRDETTTYTLEDFDWYEAYIGFYEMKNEEDK